MQSTASAASSLIARFGSLIRFSRKRGTSASDHLAAIGVQYLSGHVRGILTSEEQVARRHLAGRHGAAAYLSPNLATESVSKLTGRMGLSVACDRPDSSRSWIWRRHCGHCGGYREDHILRVPRPSCGVSCDARPGGTITNRNPIDAFTASSSCLRRRVATRRGTTGPPRLTAKANKIENGARRSYRAPFFPTPLLCGCPSR